jgi:hypothetical protein
LLAHDAAGVAVLVAGAAELERCSPVSVCSPAGKKIDMYP